MLTKFQWDDPFQFDKQLTADERFVRDKARQYAEENLKPRIRSAFATETFDKAIYRELGERQLLGGTIQGYGCPGLNAVSYGLIAREIERVDSGYRSAVSIPSSLSMQAIYLFGSDAQKQLYLPKMAAGEWIGCFGLTEPDYGSDPGSLITVATQVADGYELTGHKKWISNSPLADVLIIWAKTDDQRIRGFIVEKGARGLETPTMTGKLSLRAIITGEIILHKVFVPTANVLPLAEGLSSPLKCLDSARYGIAWGVLGAAETCWHIARQYVLDRKQFQRALAANQLIQVKLATMQTNISIALQAILRVGRLKDENLVESPLISLMKRHNTLIALDVAREARDMLGGNGILSEYDVMRHLMNLETVKTYEGTADIHALVLGYSQTNISAFR